MTIIPPTNDTLLFLFVFPRKKNLFQNQISTASATRFNIFSVRNVNWSFIQWFENASQNTRNTSKNMEESRSARMNELDIYKYEDDELNHQKTDKPQKIKNSSDNFSDA